MQTLDEEMETLMKNVRGQKDIGNELEDAAKELQSVYATYKEELSKLKY